MGKRSPIRRGAIGRGLSVSLAGARAGGALALDATFRKLRGADPWSSPLAAQEAQRFAKRLGQLKGSYVKIGQLFALLGEHFLPEPLTVALHELAAGTEPLDWAHIAPVLQLTPDLAWDALDIDTEALAAASLAQVHRARVRATGQQLVLKVQYPDLRGVIDDDFDAVVRMLRLARWLPAGRDFDGWLEAMRSQLHDEVDYPRELRFAHAVAASVSALPITLSDTVPLKIPRYFAEYSSADVLAIEWIEGFPVNHPKILELPQQQRNALGRTMLALFLREVFDWRLMQTDSNFGNYLIAPDGAALVPLDYGSFIELDEDFALGLEAVILGGHESDEGRVCDGLIRLGCLNRHSSSHARATFISFVTHLLEPLRRPEQLPLEHLNAVGHYRWADSDLMQRAGRKAAGSAASRHFATPSGAFAVIARKLTGVFTFISVLGAEFNGHDVLAPYLDQGPPP